VPWTLHLANARHHGAARATHEMRATQRAMDPALWEPCSPGPANGSDLGTR